MLKETHVAWAYLESHMFNEVHMPFVAVLGIQHLDYFEQKCIKIWR